MIRGFHAGSMPDPFSRQRATGEGTRDASLQGPRTSLVRKSARCTLCATFLRPALPEQNGAGTRDARACYDAEFGFSRRSFLLASGTALTGLFTDLKQALAEVEAPVGTVEDLSSVPAKTQSNAVASPDVKPASNKEPDLKASMTPPAATSPPETSGVLGSESAGKKKSPEELDAEAKRILEEEQAKKKKRRNKFQELADVREDLRQKQVQILEREAELLDAEQTVAVLREELQLERSLRDLLTKEKEKAEEEAKLALGLCGQGYLMP